MTKSATATIAALTALLVAGCGSSPSDGTVVGASTPSVTSQSTTGDPPPPRQAARTSVCISGGDYGGLGASEADFRQHNDMTAPTEPVMGIAWYEVTDTVRGCVTGYTVRAFARTSLRASDILFLLDGIALPDDKQQVTSTSSCAVWKSEALRRATGYLYANGTAIAQSGTSAPAEAHIALRSDPANC